MTEKNVLRTGRVRELWNLVACMALAACGSEPTRPPVPDDPVPATVEIVSGDGQVTLARSALPEPITVRVRDQDGLPIAAVRVRATPSGTGRAEPAATSTGFDGTVSVSWTLGDRVGEQTLRLEVDGIADPSVVTAEGAELDAVDVLRLDALPGGSVGLLASGQTIFGEVRDYDILVTEPESAFGDFRAGATRSELAVLSPDGTPRLVRNPWTDGIDEVEVSVSTPLEVPLTVRVLQSPFEATRETVEDELAFAAEIFEREGLGITLTDVEIVDATGVEGTDALADFVCSERTTLESTVGHDDDRLNVYYLTTVDGSTSRGQSCIIGGNFVAMASLAGDDLLAHEIGHMFGLFHIDNQEGFNQTNVMHSASNVRRFLTEGQIFRAHWRSNSSMGVLGLISAELTRNCGGQHDPRHCPAVDLRLFDDVTSAGEAAAFVSPHGSHLTELESALRKRCSAGEDPAAYPAGVDPADLRRAFRDRNRPRDVREEALRLLVLSEAPEVDAVLTDALEEDARAFGPVARWGRAVLQRN